MSDELTREELNAVIETTRKQTEQMVVIATSLSTIVSSLTKITSDNEKILSKLSNGIKEDIAIKVKAEIENCSIAKDIHDTKFFVGVVGIAIVVASALLNVIDRRWSEAGQIKRIIQTEQQLQK
jgi:hypothetical protein